MSLDELFIKYGTDKGGPWGWGYSEAYEKHLLPMRMSAKNVLEIGICGYRDIPNNVVGASLYAWRDYLPNADIYGVDNDGRFIFKDARIRTALCDAYDAQLLPTLKAWGSDLAFDFICDDAVHEPVYQMKLLRALWPLVKPGGIYAIEEACPYKVPGGDLGKHMVVPLMQEHDDMTCVEYHTHKPECLLIFTKAR